MVGDEDRAFHEHNCGEGGGPPESAQDGCKRNSHDAGDEEQRDGGMHELDAN